jgi:hypothetical protein
MSISGCNWETSPNDRSLPSRKIKKNRFLGLSRSHVGIISVRQKNTGIIYVEAFLDLGDELPNFNFLPHRTASSERKFGVTFYGT